MVILFPYMMRVKELFGIIHKEMDEHMKKEETILFPRILEIEKSAGQDNAVSGRLYQWSDCHDGT